jgi:hypothetical protein
MGVLYRDIKQRCRVPPAVISVEILHFIQNDRYELSLLFKYKKEVQEISLLPGASGGVPRLSQTSPMIGGPRGLIFNKRSFNNEKRA